MKNAKRAQGAVDGCEASIKKASFSCLFLIVFTAGLCLDLPYTVYGFGWSHRRDPTLKAEENETPCEQGSVKIAGLSEQPRLGAAAGSIDRQPHTYTQTPGFCICSLQTAE